MGFLEEQLGSLADADARRFAGGSFAEDRLGSVATAVKRRRAVRAAGVGGVSVVGASALAMGGANLPWSSMGFGFAPAGGAVVCTTTTPAGSADVKIPDDATYVVIDDANNEVYVVGGTTEAPLAWSSDGSKRRFTGVGALTQLELDSGIRVGITLDTQRGVEVAPVDGVTIVTPTEYEKMQAPSNPAFSVLTVDIAAEGAGVSTYRLVDANGAGFATVEVDGTSVTATFINGDTWNAEAEPGVTVGYEAPDGTVLDAQVVEGQLVVSKAINGLAETSGAPMSDSVTCVTTTPRPSESAAPSPSEVTSTVPTAAALASDSPFECGFSFPEDTFGADELTITGGLTTEASIRSTFLEWYGNQPPTTEVENSNAPAYRASVEYDVAGYPAGVLDPVRVVESDKAFGFAFVAVRDGVVVGTIEPESDGTSYGMVEDRDGTSGPVQAFLWDRAAFTPCGPASIEDAEIYAVAGAKQGGEVTYGWAWMTQ